MGRGHNSPDPSKLPFLKRLASLGSLPHNHNLPYTDKQSVFL